MLALLFITDATARKIDRECIGKVTTKVLINTLEQAVDLAGFVHAKRTSKQIA